MEKKPQGKAGARRRVYHASFEIYGYQSHKGAKGYAAEYGEYDELAPETEICQLAS
jgi:hypothetical protein